MHSTTAGSARLSGSQRSIQQPYRSSAPTKLTSGVGAAVGTCSATTKPCIEEALTKAYESKAPAYASFTPPAPLPNNLPGSLCTHTNRSICFDNVPDQRATPHMVPIYSLHCNAGCRQTSQQALAGAALHSQNRNRNASSTDALCIGRPLQPTQHKHQQARHHSTCVSAGTSKSYMRHMCDQAATHVASGPHSSSKAPGYAVVNN